MNTKKLISITGGTKGIGSEIAEYFLEKNWIVLIGSRQKSGLANISHDNLHFFKIDVKNEKDHQKFYQYARKISKNYQLKQKQLKDLYNEKARNKKIIKR